MLDYKYYEKPPKPYSNYEGPYIRCTNDEVKSKPDQRALALRPLTAADRGCHRFERQVPYKELRQPTESATFLSFQSLPIRMQQPPNQSLSQKTLQTLSLNIGALIIRIRFRGRL